MQHWGLLGAEALSGAPLENARARLMDALHSWGRTVVDEDGLAALVSEATWLLLLLGRHSGSGAAPVVAEMQAELQRMIVRSTRLLVREFLQRIPLHTLGAARRRRGAAVDAL
jgi:hypothetical protein